MYTDSERPTKPKYFFTLTKILVLCFWLQFNYPHFQIMRKSYSKTTRSKEMFDNGPKQIGFASSLAGTEVDWSIDRFTQLYVET